VVPKLAEEGEVSTGERARCEQGSRREASSAQDQPLCIGKGPIVSVHTILVVADEPITRNMIVHVLTGRGFRVYEADSEAETEILCKSLGSEAFDLVIADHHVASTTGRALAERVLKSCPGAKVLQLSILSFHDMQAQDALVGDGGFLQRPFSPEQLLDAVRAALDPRTQ
jgi:two-component system, cell cycle sensor histidine kinase and response regulator CckA